MKKILALCVATLFVFNACNYCEWASGAALASASGLANRWTCSEKGKLKMAAKLTKVYSVGFCSANAPVTKGAAMAMACTILVDVLAKYKAKQWASEFECKDIKQIEEDLLKGQLLCPFLNFVPGP